MLVTGLAATVDTMRGGWWWLSEAGVRWTVEHDVSSFAKEFFSPRAQRVTTAGGVNSVNYSSGGRNWDLMFNCQSNSTRISD